MLASNTDRPRSPSPARDSTKSHPKTNNNDANYNSDEGDYNPGTQLYIRGLSYRTTEQELRDVFEKYGQLEEVSVVKDPHLNECRGFAFVRFVRKEDANKALEAEHDADFHGRRLIVELSRRTRPRPKTPGEYLGRLSVRELEMRQRRDNERRGYDRYDSRGGSSSRDRYDDRGYDRDRYSRDRYDDRDRYGSSSRDRYDDRRDYGRDRDRDYGRSRY